VFDLLTGNDLKEISSTREQDHRASWVLTIDIEGLVIVDDNARNNADMAGATVANVQRPLGD
jgi:hypothetical protein